MSVKNDSRNMITEFVFSGFDNVQRPLAAGVVMLILYIFAMIANTATIIFIIMDKRLHHPMYVFICNLAFVDILYCTDSCPTMIGILLVGYKTISYNACMVQMFFFHFSGTMEMFAITVMAFDRFLAVRLPLQYSSLMTNWRSVFINISIWLVAALIMSMLPASVAPLPTCYSKVKYVFCDYASIIRATCIDPEPYFNDAAVVRSFLIFGTFSFICFSYINIVIVVSRITLNNDKKKAMHTCLSHIIIIVCYYVPTFTAIVLTRIGVVLTLEERNGLMVGSILVPSLVNPFIYCFRTKEIKSKILTIFSKVKTVKK